MCFWDSAAFRRRWIVTPSELGVSGAWSEACLSVEAEPPRASGASWATAQSLSQISRVRLLPIEMRNNRIEE